jgi:hypothetical protein
MRVRSGVPAEGPKAVCHGGAAARAPVRHELPCQGVTSRATGAHRGDPGGVEAERY